MQKKQAKGTFWIRAFIVLLAVVFGILVYWSSSFLLNDIKFFKMPTHASFTESSEKEQLQKRLKELQSKLVSLNNQHKLLTQQRGFIKDSSSAMKIVVDNLFTLRDRNQQLVSGTQFQNLLTSLDKVIQVQEKFQTTADQYLKVTNEKFAVEKQISELQEQIATLERALNAKYYAAVKRRHFYNTILQMVFLLPLLVLCSFVLYKKRESLYRLIFAAATVAIYWKTAMVMHEHFPSRYFKYILITALLVAVAWCFCYLIRRLVHPRIDALLRQYREAYERFLCPVCEYPIRTGPRRFLFWTRRTVHKMALNNLDSGQGEEEAYSCPDCGTELFEVCESCGKIRHSLLKSCRHCGAEKDISGDQY